MIVMMERVWLACKDGDEDGVIWIAVKKNYFFLFLDITHAFCRFRIPALIWSICVLIASKEFFLQRFLGGTTISDILVFVPF